MSRALSLLAALGRSVMAFLAAVGRVTIFAAQAISHIFRPPFYPKELGQALLSVGYFSLPVVGLTAFFTGGALALQIYSGGARFNAEAVVPRDCRRRHGARAWPGAGRSDDRGAGHVLYRRRDRNDEGDRADRRPGHALDPPDEIPHRATGACRADRGAGSGGDRRCHRRHGRVYGQHRRLDFNPATYLQNTVDFIEAQDVASSLVKGRGVRLSRRPDGVFYGMHSGRGAQGVGRATKASVVAAAVLILAANYLLTELFFSA